MQWSAPEIARMRERILVLRDIVLEKNDLESTCLRRSVEVPARFCSVSPEVRAHVFTVNRPLGPESPIRACERQFWRTVNVSPGIHADLQIVVDGEIVALRFSKNVC